MSHRDRAEARQKQFDLLFMDLAHKMAEMSTCVSKKVGTVLTHKNRVIAMGYNGSLPGCLHCTDVFHEPIETDEQRIAHHHWAGIHEVHAECNAIIDAGARGVLKDGMTAYCTLFPCINCMKTMIRAGVRKIYYAFEYDLDGGNANARQLCADTWGITLKCILDV